MSPTVYISNNSNSTDMVPIKYQCEGLEYSYGINI